MRKYQKNAAIFILVLMILSVASASEGLINATERITASPTTHTVTVNGEVVPFAAYNILGNNFFRLRDIAYVLNGTSGQFEIGWNEQNHTISIVTGIPYTPVGNEMENAAYGGVSALLSNATIIINGEETVLTAYVIEGSNFFRLLDLGYALNFTVGWDPVAYTVIILTN